MLLYSTALVLIFLHFFSDFLFQLPRTSNSRGCYPTTLVTHCVLYAIPFLLFGLNFFILVLSTHWLTDFYISKLLNKLWLERRARRHRLVVGLDQSLHIAVLFIIYWIVEPENSAWNYIYNSFIGMK